jgi:hypothetical protein
MFNFANDFPFITLNAIFTKIVRQLLEEHAMQNISTDTVQKIAVNYLKKRKNTEKIDVSTVEQKNGVWIIRGVCPIDLEGHPWAEKFEIVIDEKGKIKSTDFSLL